MHHITHDISYERKTLALMGVGFGLVGLDRWIIAPLFPHIMKDLGLDFEQLGILVGVLSLTWGAWSIAMGRMSDRIGRKKILVTTMIAFSVLSAVSGFATSFVSLLLIRAAIGIAEGTFTPASVAATSEASRQERRGFNLGLQLSMHALLGMGFAPIIATQLLGVLPSWHWVFVVSAVPGLVVAALIMCVLRDDTPVHSALVATDAPRWGALFGSRNVKLATVAILCAMAGIFVISALVPTYLVQVLKLSTPQMGFVVSAIGFGGWVGSFGVSGLSDRIGRRPAAIGAFVGAAVLVSALTHTGAQPQLLFALLFGLSVCAVGVLALIAGPIATEAAPAGLIASSVGLVSGAGEIFGGGFAPMLAGYVAQHFGLPRTLDIAFGGFVCGAIISFALLETAPSRQRRVDAAAMAVDLER